MCLKHEEKITRKHSPSKSYELARIKREHKNLRCHAEDGILGLPKGP